MMMPKQLEAPASQRAMQNNYMQPPPAEIHKQSASSKQINA